MKKADIEYYKEEYDALLKPTSLNEIIQMVEEKGSCLVFVIDLYRLIYDREGRFIGEHIPSYMFCSEPQKELLSWMDLNDLKIGYFPPFATPHCFDFQTLANLSRFSKN